ncbi:MAG: DUF1579 domain-containing protein [Planctomycetes bacterium]|nr:DUF1579 domain-containing protein [Planctomycetota bacterium]
MRASSVGLFVVAAAVCGWFGRSAFSEDAPKGGMPTKAEMEKMMETLATPGEMHAWLAQPSGAWDLAGKMYEMDGKTVENKGSATFSMVLGGRFQQQTLSGEFKGKKFEGVGITGYDNLKKQFVNYWFDTMGTAPSVATGQRSADGKTLTLTGTWDMPFGPMPFRYVMTHKSEKEMLFAAFGSRGGQEFPMMEMTYTRK